MAGGSRKPSVMFIAGEPSGDLHASGVIRNIRERRPDAEVWGIGGPAMAAAGLEQVMPFERFNRMGYVEVLRHLPFFLGAQKTLTKMMESRRPDVLVCVDYSGFNMPMLKRARKLGVPVVWYIAPMVWMWKRKRAAVLGGLASHIAAIFPFEPPYFSPYKAPVTFVGNPLTESLPQISASGRKFPENGGFRLAIIPGSRAQELKKMLPLMLDAASMLKQKYPRLKVTVSRFSKFDESVFAEAKKRGFELFAGPLPELLQKSDLALITSGTATLETALLGVPMVITYRASPLTYIIYEHFVKKNNKNQPDVKKPTHLGRSLPPWFRIGLPNIIANKTIVPECVQNNATPKNLYEKADKFLSNSNYWEETVQNLSTLRAQLGEKKPSKEVANIIYSYIC
jgi:lipid-A-disaccharide synthase